VIGLNDAVTKLDFLKNLIISMLASIATWLPTASKKNALRVLMFLVDKNQVSVEEY